MNVVEIVEGLYIKSGYTPDHKIPQEWARLDIREGGPPNHPDFLHIEISDDTRWSHEVITRIVDYIRSRLAQGKSVVVGCISGVSRSPAAVLAYLMAEGRLPVVEALEQLRQAYPPADPSAVILDSLEEYFQAKGHIPMVSWRNAADSYSLDR